ncbi:MAG: DUF1624 domain-containing protein [Clostridia bacterium]|nr:DUF1624 domain-containing protein [Clostridia bacterium]
MKKRFETLDSLRGSAVVSMVIFHLMFDINEIFGGNTSWSSQPLVHLWQRSICFTFIIVSGFVWSLGRKGALKRGIFLTAVGVAVTAVTVIFMPSSPVYFGVMSFFGCAVLIMLPAEKLLRYVPAPLGAAFSLAAFFLTEYAAYGVLKVFGYTLCKLPKALFASSLGIPFGFPPSDFFSSDYYPIFPWIFLYFFGYFLSRLFINTKIFHRIAHFKEPFFSFVGRHAVVIYVIHQPLCYAACMLFFG